MNNHFLDVEENGESAQVPAPRICIVLLTYLRTNLALRTIQAVIRNLDYPQELRGWYIADDGSPREHIQHLTNELSVWGEELIGFHNKRSIPGTPFCGLGWNRALARAHQNADILLWLEDDWELERKLDIRPYVRLLIEREDVGILSMRGLTVGNELRVEGYRGRHYLSFLRRTAFAYSGNPLLRHVRFRNYYGVFSTDRSPGDMEIEYDERFRRKPDGPAIWRPVELGGWGIWGHIGNERTW